MPIFDDAETEEPKPIQIVPEFVDFAVIVHPVAFVAVEVSWTGVPAVVTFVDPCPAENASADNAITRAMRRDFISTIVVKNNALSLDGS